MRVEHAPSRPIRQWLVAWAIATRDPVEVIARGFDLDAALVLDLLGPEPARLIDVIVARDLCRHLRIDPAELWRSDIARLVGPCDWPAEALWAEVDSVVASLAGRV